MNRLSQIQTNSNNFQKSFAFFAEKKRPLVLIADGNEENRAHLKTLLISRGVNILETESGEEVLDLSVAERPDLILTNTELSCLDGFNAARLIRAIKSFDNTR